MGGSIGKPFHGNLHKETSANPYYRKVIYTDPKMQLVYMSLDPSQEIGMEIHHTATQFIRVEKGEGEAIIDGKKYKLHDDDAIIVPLGAEHNIKNKSRLRKLKLYTIYSPPRHSPDTIEEKKSDGDSL